MRTAATTGALSLARATLSHAWRRVAFLTTILAAAGLICYLQLGVTVGQLLSFANAERLTSADLVVATLPARRGVGLGVATYPLPSDAVDIVSRSPLVEASEKVTVRRLTVDLGDAEYLELKIVETRPPALSLPITMTDEVVSLLDKPFGIVLSEKAARKTGLALGSTVPLRGQTLRVLGIVRGSLGARDSMISKMTYEALAKDLPAPRRAPVSSVLVRLVDGSDPADAAKQLTASLKSLGAAALTREQLVDRITRTAVEARIDLQGFLIVAVMVAVVAMIIVMQAMIGSVAAQSAEFGIMLALGTSRRRLASIVLEQVFWIGTLGAAFAIVGALAAKIILSALSVEYALLPNFVLLISAVSIGSAILGGIASLPAVFSIKPIDLLR